MSNGNNWSAASLLRDVNNRHERLKNYVHEGFRVPLPKWGRFLMGCFYFSIPLVGGHYVMQWAISKSHESIGEQGEKLQVKDLQGFGNKRLDEDGTLKQVGAGGWGAGVKLAVSDGETQKRNGEMLDKYFKKQRRKLEKAEKQKQLEKEKKNSDTM
jgi:hypothetical protein